MSHPSPYSDLPPERYWRTGVSEVHPLTAENLYKKKFDILPTDPVATAGSCFAQHIARYMRNSGLRVIDEEPAPQGMSDKNQAEFGYGMFAARYGNIYACRQLLQLAQEAFRRQADPDVVWTKGGRYFDALRPGVEPNGLTSPDEVLEHRLHHLGKVRRVLTRMSLFIFTFGLTEAWTHKATGKVYPTCPGTIAGEFNPEHYELRNFTYPEVHADFIAFRRLVKRHNPAARFLLTVSPVPLAATATAQHVLVATTYSKSVLRAVAGDLATALADVDYFPSYELIVSPWSRGFFYEPNLRSVNPAGVEMVMRMFLRVHGLERYAKGQRTAKATREEVACEEALLERFTC